MKVKFHEGAWEECLYWQQIDKAMVKRINQLIRAIQRQPFEGIGKPEPLRHEFSGLWSRRITDEHRLVYFVEADVLTIVQCRYHYSA